MLKFYCNWTKWTRQTIKNISLSFTCNQIVYGHHWFSCCRVPLLSCVPRKASKRHFDFSSVWDILLFFVFTVSTVKCSFLNTAILNFRTVCYEKCARVVVQYKTDTLVSRGHFQLAWKRKKKTTAKEHIGILSRFKNVSWQDSFMTSKFS